MKKSPLRRKTRLKSGTAQLAARRPPRPKCECGHSVRRHWNHALWPHFWVAGVNHECAERGCGCKKYQPRVALKKGGRLKPRKADPSKRRFAKLRLPEYAAWIRTQLCVLSRTVSSDPGVWEKAGGDIEAAHVKSRGAGGADAANLVPLCRGHHAESHSIGQRSFEKKYSIYLKSIAEKLWAEYQATGASSGRGTPTLNTKGVTR